MKFKAGKQTPKRKALKSSMVRGSFMGGDDSAGVADGLSARADMDSANLHNVNYDEAIDPLTGNPTGRPKPYASKSVKEKGHDFDIC